jgi:AcrR family transcriptional regulator
MADTTRERITNAARRIIMEEGVSRLTLADVAEKAGISKGGLLYHFPSKEELIKGMIKEALTNFARNLERLANDDGNPGAWTRAYVQATFPEQSDVLAAPMIAGIATDPSLLDVYNVEQLSWTHHIEADGIDRVLADVVRLAADGLFFNEALGIRPLAPRDRARFLKRILQMTKEPSVAKSPATVD